MKIIFEDLLKEDWSQGIVARIRVSNDSIHALMKKDSGRFRNEFFPVMSIPACSEENKSIYDIVGRDSLRYKLAGKYYTNEFGYLNVDTKEYSTINIDIFDSDVKYFIDGGIRTLKAVAVGKMGKDIIKEEFRIRIIDGLREYGLHILSAEADIYVGKNTEYGKPTLVINLL